MIAGRIALGLFFSGMLVLGVGLRASPTLATWLEDWRYDSGCGPSLRASSAQSSLLSIASAQLDYRTRDRDGNRVDDYWRGDIAGLYTIQSPRCEGHPAIKLIEQSVACADDRPVTDIGRYAARCSKYGYWFRALRHEDEESPSPDRFAACAFPESRAAGKYTFIIDETRTLYRKRLPGQSGVVSFPRDPERAGWTKLY